MANPADLFQLVDEITEDRQGTPFAHAAPRDYTRKFLVITKIKGLAAATVCRAPGLPLPYSPYAAADYDVGLTEFDLTCLLTRMTARQTGDDWSRWEVTCQYSTDLGAGGQPTEGPGAEDGTGSFGSSPQGAGNKVELEPAEIEWDFVEASEALPYDLDKKPFLNSAKQPLQPAVTTDVAFPVLVVTRNERYFNRETAHAYAFAVNKDTFLGAPPGTVLCMPPKAKWTWKGPIGYYRVTYRLKFNLLEDDPLAPPSLRGLPRTWQPKYLDQGLCQLDKTPNSPTFEQPVPIYRGSGPITQPVLLDGAGSPQLPQPPPEKGGGMDGGNAIGLRYAINPVYLPFRTRRSLSFKDLLSRGVGARLE